MTAARFQLTFCVDPAHPCLAGHFPGRPLVPGVMLLEQVASGLRRWRDQRMARVLDAKFLAPLQPGREAQVQLEAVADSAQVRFRIVAGDTLLARGRIEGST